MRVGAVRRYALVLPEVSEAPHHHFGSFRVRGKIFVTVTPEQDHIHVFVSEADREMALAMHGEFMEKLSWGGKVVGLRVALGAAQPAAVRALVRQAWARKAPKALQAALPRNAGEGDGTVA